MEYSQVVGSHIELLERLDEAGICYAILHGWRTMLKKPPSDLDLVIASSDLEKLENHLRHSYQIVQAFRYEAFSFGFVLAVKDGANVHFITLDITSDYRWAGRVFSKQEDLLQGRKRWNGFWVLASQKEFAFLLLKKIYEKGFVAEHQRGRLQELVGELGGEAGTIAWTLFGSSWGEKVVNWVIGGMWDELEAKVGQLRRVLRWQTLKRDPLNPFRYWLPEVGRAWQRWCHPTGLCVAVLGPDGVGKSTLIQHLQETLAAAFRRTAVFHLRPNLLGRQTSNGPVTDPHGKAPHPWWLSLLKIPYYLADYSLGYLFKVRPRLVHSTLVLFDRYYHDLLVDPRRYRYSDSTRPARVTCKFVPKPDLFLILDVAERELLDRKQEVSLDEMRRQREAYRQLAARVPNAILLDGSLLAEKVARNASDAVLSYLYKRYLKRRHLLLPGDNCETLRWLAMVLCSSPHRVQFVALKNQRHKADLSSPLIGTFGWLALKDGRGYLLSLNSRQAAVRALSLYNAQSCKAKLTKRLLAAGLKLGLAQMLLSKVHVIVQESTSGKQATNTVLLEHLKKVLGRRDLSFSVSLGTPGPHLKPVLQVLTQRAKSVAYVKVGWNEATNVLVQHEAEVLEQLAKGSFNSFTVPRVLYAGSWKGRYLCVQSPPNGKVKLAPQEMTPGYVKIIRELAIFHTRWIPLRESDFWKRLQNRINQVPSEYYHHVLQQGIVKVEKRLGNASLPFHFRHGDFAPWNVKRANGRLFVFDWEYADAEAPAGWDLVHFFVQTLRLLRKQSSSEIWRTFQEGGMAHTGVVEFVKSLSFGCEAVDSIFLLYPLELLAFCASEDPTNFLILQHLAVTVNLSLHKVV